MFRLANERMADWEEVRVSEAVERYLCECADPACREQIGLRKSEYESVRSDSRHFVTVRGHEIPDVETVIEKHDGWVVVEKDPEVSGDRPVDRSAFQRLRRFAARGVLATLALRTLVWPFARPG